MADVKIEVTREQLEKLGYDTMLALGFSESDAKYASKSLNAADVRGVDTHGVARLLMYDKLIQNEQVNKNAKMKILNETESTLYLDADHGLGIIMAPQAVEMCIEKAKKSGACVTSVKNSGHFGIAGYYAEQMAKNGMIGIAMSNSIAIVAPFGGRGRVLGNSPFSIAFPAGNEYTDPIMLDMASSQVALGKLEMAIRAGKEIPKGWAVDEKGIDTTDPKVGFEKGALLPFGGPKGYCLDVLIEMMSTVLPDSGYGEDVHFYTAEKGLKENMGHTFIAIDVSKFRPLEDIRKDVDKYADRLKNVEPAEGVEEVFLPGEIEARNYHKRIAKNFEINHVVLEEILAITIRTGRLGADATIEDLLKL